jgi:phage-related protein
MRSASATSACGLRAGLPKGCRLFAFMRTLIVPLTEVIFYKEGDTVPVREWLKSLPSKVARKCLLYLDMLEQQGHELRRPIADFLRDGIYELRPRFQGVNYRILYFFSGRNMVVVSHGIVKESEVPETEIARAVQRKQSFQSDPKSHSYRRSQ